jgi:hypothetical protein
LFQNALKATKIFSYLLAKKTQNTKNNPKKVHKQKKGIVHRLPQAIKFLPSRCKYVQKSLWDYFIKGL